MGYVRTCQGRHCHSHKLRGKSLQSHDISKNKGNSVWKYMSLNSPHISERILNVKIQGIFVSFGQGATQFWSWPTWPKVENQECWQLTSFVNHSELLVLLISTLFELYMKVVKHFKYFSTYHHREFVNWHCSVTEMSLYTGKIFYCVQKC